MKIYLICQDDRFLLRKHSFERDPTYSFTEGLSSGEIQTAFARNLRQTKHLRSHVEKLNMLFNEKSNILVWKFQSLDPLFVCLQIIS